MSERKFKGLVEKVFHTRESWLAYHFARFIGFVEGRHEHRTPDCGCQTCDEIAQAKFALNAEVES